MKTNQNVVQVFHAGLTSQSLAMLRAMLAMRACHSGLRMVAEAAWAATWLRPRVCWLVRSLPSWQSSSLWFPRAIWCLHQHQVRPLTFFSCVSPSLGGVFFQFLPLFCSFLLVLFFLFFCFLLSPPPCFLPPACSCRRPHTGSEA